VAAFTDDMRRRLEEAVLWHVATLNPDGSPQVTPMWADVRGDRILLNTAKGRKKHRNMTSDSRVAMSSVTPDLAPTDVAIQGRIVETYGGERADRDIDTLAKKYMGVDTYPFRRPGEERVSFLVEPRHVFSWSR
jgi:PPOX class probable F420-dependent enzyme